MGDKTNLILPEARTEVSCPPLPLYFSLFFQNNFILALTQEAIQAIIEIRRM